MSKEKQVKSPWRIGISAGLGYFLMDIMTSILNIDYYMPRDGLLSLRLVLDFVIYIIFIFIVDCVIGKLYFDKKESEKNEKDI